MVTRAKSPSRETEERAQTVRSLMSSESNEWYTPAKYIEAVRQVLGEIDLDPASHEIANQTVRAKAYYDKEANGLGDKWYGRVFLNPPYREFASYFVAKLLDEYGAGRVLEAIVLLNNHRTDTSWFQPLFDFPLCFTDHRISFYRASTLEPIKSPTHGSVFVYLGPNKARFADVFGSFGTVVTKVTKRKISKWRETERLSPEAPPSRKRAAAWTARPPIKSAGGGLLQAIAKAVRWKWLARFRR